MTATVRRVRYLELDEPVAGAALASYSVIQEMMSRIARDAMETCPNYLAEEPGKQAIPPHLRRLGYVMDEAIKLPGGFRIGLDGIVGLVPGLGDAAGLLVSAYIIVAAAQRGIPKRTLTKMIVNVGFETAVGVVPVIGDIFDFAYKANSRNLRLMHEHSRAPAKTTRSSSIWLIALGLLALCAITVVVVIGVLTLSWILSLLAEMRLPLI